MAMLPQFRPQTSSEGVQVQDPSQTMTVPVVLTPSTFITVPQQQPTAEMVGQFELPVRFPIADVQHQQQQAQFFDYGAHGGNPRFRGGRGGRPGRGFGFERGRGRGRGGFEHRRDSDRFDDRQHQRDEGEDHGRWEGRSGFDNRRDSDRYDDRQQQRDDSEDQARWENSGGGGGGGGEPEDRHSNRRRSSRWDENTHSSDDQTMTLNAPSEPEHSVSGDKPANAPSETIEEHSHEVPNESGPAIRVTLLGR